MILATWVRKMAYIGLEPLKPPCVASSGLLTILAPKSPVRTEEVEI